MASTSKDQLEHILSNFDENTKKPENFLSVQKNSATNFVNFTKELYDFTQQTDIALADNALQELLIQDFDDEQIWQEIELKNDPSVKDLVKNVSRLAATKTFHFELISESAGDVEENSAEDLEFVASDKSDGDASEGSHFSEDVADTNIGPFSKAGDDSNDDEEDEKLKMALDRLTGEDGDENESDMSEELSDSINFDFDSANQAKAKTDKVVHSKGKSGQKSPSKANVKRKTIVDDKFFKLADMETFLDQEDAKEERKIRLERGESESSDSEECDNMDIFAAGEDTSSEEEKEAGLKYEDFFDPPEDEERDQIKVREVEAEKKLSGESHDDMEDEGEIGFNSDNSENDSDDDAEEEEEEEDQKSKNRDLFSEDESSGEDAEDIIGHKRKQEESQFEQRQARMKQKISEIEEDMMTEKPWQLTGEASAKSRPENSLLQEDLDFEHTTKVAPVITEETTLKLEDFIKQRIRDKAWDDVERKVKPKEEAFEYKKRVVLDQEKSKLSLGEVYEQEYIKQTMNEEEEKTDPAHEAIKKMMSSLFVKLDALTNFHFMPKPAAPDIKIVSNLPSITVEEVAPTSVSDAALLAPEEVKDKDKGAMKGDTEKDKTDKKRALREKKKNQREKKKAREDKQKLLEKVNPGLGNKYAKEKAMKELEKQSKHSKKITVIKDDKKKSGLTSSTKFFSQLQEEVTTHIQTKKASKLKKKKDKSLSSAKLKL